MGIPLGSPRHRPTLGLTWKQTIETYEREGLVDLTIPCTCGSLRAIRFNPQHVGCRRCGAWVPQPELEAGPAGSFMTAPFTITSETLVHHPSCDQCSRHDIHRQRECGLAQQVHHLAPDDVVRESHSAVDE